MKKILPIISTALILAQTSALLGRTWWFFELFTHYTVYYALLGTVLLISSIPLHRWKTALLLTIMISINLATFSPYLTTQNPTSSTPDNETISILSQNFFFKNTNFDEIQTLLQENNPDIFIIHEAGPQWNAAIENFKAAYPYIQITKETGIQGILLGSKNPGTFLEIPLGNKFGLEFIPDNQSYRVLAVHPFAPITQTYAEERNAQFADITNYINSSTIPTLVVGDFNCTPWSPFFQDLLSNANLKDTRLGFGIVPTWQAHNFLFQLPIDFILATPQFHTTSFQTTTKTSADHLGIFAELNL